MHPKPFFLKTNLFKIGGWKKPRMVRLLLDYVLLNKISILIPFKNLGRIHEAICFRIFCLARITLIPLHQFFKEMIAFLSQVQFYSVLNSLIINLKSNKTIKKRELFICVEGNLHWKYLLDKTIYYIFFQGFCLIISSVSLRFFFC